MAEAVTRCPCGSMTVATATYSPGWVYTNAWPARPGPVKSTVPSPSKSASTVEDAGAPSREKVAVSAATPLCGLATSANEKSGADVTGIDIPWLAVPPSAVVATAFREVGRLDLEGVRAGGEARQRGARRRAERGERLAIESPRELEAGGRCEKVVAAERERRGRRLDRPAGSTGDLRGGRGVIDRDDARRRDAVARQVRCAHREGVGAVGEGPRIPGCGPGDRQRRRRRGERRVEALEIHAESEAGHSGVVRGLRVDGDHLANERIGRRPQEDRGRRLGVGGRDDEFQRADVEEGVAESRPLGTEISEEE